MENNQDNTNKLLSKLEILLQKQEEFSREINTLKTEIHKVHENEKSPPVTEVLQKEIKPIIKPVPERVFVDEETHQKAIENFQAKTTQRQTIQPKTTQKTDSRTPKPKKVFDLEKFIGENLLNKIGIAITVIGVAIGAKYSIENNLISPLTRIVLGYFAGIGLLAFGIKLKKKYEDYSAVLVSGSIAILYFITYAAYSFYNLYPQIVAFLLMVVFTVCTVLTAIKYNKQVIAHIGLVGAYAIPFLLSDGTGNVTTLFGYMVIINLGILFLTYKKYWKPLFFSSFSITWLIFFTWFAGSFKESEHFIMAFSFLSIFFLIFYFMALSFKVLKKEKFGVSDILLILFNSFLFYGIGYAILNGHTTGDEYLGVFTFCNGLIYLLTSLVIHKQKLADKNLYYFLLGLGITFITITIPVQLDRSWVTLLWVAQAALLFWIGKTKNTAVYEKLSYPIMVLAFISLSQDWNAVATLKTNFTPLLNINFMNSMLFVIAFGFITYLNQNQKYPSTFSPKKTISVIISYAIPAIFIFTLYNTFKIEIETYWNQLYGNSYPENSFNTDNIRSFKQVWLINYSLFFISALSFINLKRIKNVQLGFVSLVLIAISLVAFLTQGLYFLSELRESYLNQNDSILGKPDSFYIIIRYVSFLFVASALFVSSKLIRQDYLHENLKKTFDFVLHLTILWVASSEMIHWLDFTESTKSYKLGLSILWGVYSLLMIILGIWKQNKSLRIGAIGLFGVTLIKLFFYDISHLNTISKTIVFVSLGILLLIISFLYNKYKHLISDENKDLKKKLKFS